MRNSLKLGFVFALGATAAFSFAGCSSGSDSDGGAGSSAGGSRAGAPAGGAGAGGAHAGGAPAAGAPAGGAGAGTAGASGGVAGHAGAGGTGGTGGAGGKAGAGGTGGGAGAAGAGGATAGSGGATAGTGGGACADETAGSGGAGGAASVTTAIVLLDDVVIKDAANTAIKAEWHFADGTTISDADTASHAADQWARGPKYGDPANVSSDAGAHSTFFVCSGSTAAGSLKNVIPFTAVAQYYNVSVVTAPHDYSGHHVTAKIKLVAGGSAVATCPARGLLVAINGATQELGTPVTLLPGVWTDATLTIPATGFTTMPELLFRVTTYTCQ